MYVAGIRLQTGAGAKDYVETISEITEECEKQIHVYEKEHRVELPTTARIYTKALSLLHVLIRKAPTEHYIC